MRTPRPIDEPAAAGGRVAWIQAGVCSSGFSVWRASLSTKRRVRLTKCMTAVQGPGPLRLAGARAMWSVPFNSSGGMEATVYAATHLGQRRAVARFSTTDCSDGSCDQGASGIRTLGALAAGGAHLDHGVIIVGAGPTCSGGVCDEIATGGTVRRIPAAGGKPVTVPGAPAAALLAAAAGRIADVPLVVGADGVQASHTVDVINAGTGTFAATIAITSTIHAVALSRSMLAVLVRSAAGVDRVRRYTPTGALVGVTRLSTARPLVDDLHIARSRVVLETRSSIFELNGVTGRVRRVHLAARPILGVAVADGPRVLWFQRSSAPGGTILTLRL
jgi:hypothetical protein